METQKYSVERRIDLRFIAQVGFLGLLLPSVMVQASDMGEKFSVEVAYVDGKDQAIYSHQRAISEGDTISKPISIVEEEKPSDSYSSSPGAVSTAGKIRAVTSRRKAESPTVMPTSNKSWRISRVRSGASPDVSNSLIVSDSLSRAKRKPRP